MTAPLRRICVAPMMDWTDRHDRYFLRLISRRVLLYTEMLTTGAILHGDRDRLLAFHPDEHPLALQLGGTDLDALAACARIAEETGFDEVNLNCGCPSERVRSGRFGACLMADPDLVARCVAAMQDATQLPVTVKSRIGIDQSDSYDSLHRFIATVARAGCRTFIVHARKAWLDGLSPEQNRDIPPLRYDVVHRIKANFPDLEIVINGGITTLAEAAAHLDRVDGVMIGRAAYQNPYLLAEVDRFFFGDTGPAPSRHQLVRAMLPYIEAELDAGVRLNAITRHILGLFQGQRGARAWRRHLSEHAHLPDAGMAVVAEAAALVPEDDPLPCHAASLSAV